MENYIMTTLQVKLTMRYFVALCLFLFLAFPCTAEEQALDRYLVGDNQSFSVYYQVTTKKLWVDEVISTTGIEPRNTSFNCCKGETEIFIIFFDVKEDLTDISLSFSDLVNQNTGTNISNEIFSNQIIEPVNAIDSNNINRLAFDKITNSSVSSFISGQRTAFMIKVVIPDDIETGDYSGIISVVNNGDNLIQLPLAMHIADFKLSEQVNFIFEAGFPKYEASTNPLKRLPDDQDLPVDLAIVRNSWITQLNNDRIYTQNAGIVSPNLTNDGESYNLDFTQFDIQVDDLIQRGVLFRSRTPYLFFLTGHYWYTLEQYFGDITSPAGDKTLRDGMTFLDNCNLLPGFLTGYLDVARQINDHITAKGYRPYFYDVFCDEPAINLKDLVKQVSTALVNAVPDIRLTMLGMPSSTAEFNEYRGIQNHLFIPDNAFELVFPDGGFDKNPDEHLEVYSLYSALTLDKEPLYARLLFWWAWNIRADSMWYWIIAEWSRPDPLTCYGGNGGFYLVYPNEQNINSEFLTGIRYEQLREGLEDYEYLLELATRFAAVRNELNGDVNDFPDKTRSDELARRLVPDHRYLDEWITDSNEYIKVKAILFHEIETIANEPLILTKSKILDGAKTESSSVILNGLVDYETTVTIDGRQIMTTNGHFQYIKYLEMGENIISIVVKKGDDEKIVTRTFYRINQPTFKEIINDDFLFIDGAYRGLENWTCYDWGAENDMGEVTTPEIVLEGQVKSSGDPSIKSSYIRPLSTHSGMHRACQLVPPPEGRISFNFYTLNDIQFRLKIEVLGSLNGSTVKMQKWFPAEDTGIFNNYSVDFNQLSDYQAGVVVSKISIYVVEDEDTQADWRYWIDDFKVEYPVILMTIIDDDFSVVNGVYNGLANWLYKDWGAENDSGPLVAPEVVFDGQLLADGNPSIKSGYIRPLSTHAGMVRTCQLVPPGEGSISFKLNTLNDIQSIVKLEVVGYLDDEKIKMQKWFSAAEIGDGNSYTVKFNQLTNYQTGIAVNRISIYAIEDEETVMDWRYWVDDFKVEYPVEYSTLINDDFFLVDNEYNGFENWYCRDWGAENGSGANSYPEIVLENQVEGVTYPLIKSGYIRPLSTHSGMYRTCQLTPNADDKISFNCYLPDDIQLKVKIEVFGQINGTSVKMKKWFTAEDVNINNYSVTFSQLTDYQVGVEIDTIVIYAIEDEESSEDWRYWIDDFKVEHKIAVPEEFNAMINDDFSPGSDSYNNLAANWIYTDWGAIENEVGGNTTPEVIFVGQVLPNGNPGISSGYMRPLSSHSGLYRSCQLIPPPDGIISFNFYPLDELPLLVKIEVFGQVDGASIKMKKWFSSTDINFNNYSVTFDQLTDYQTGVEVNKIAIYAIEDDGTLADWRYWIDDFKVEYPL
jgi:hypothetical protein